MKKVGKKGERKGIRNEEWKEERRKKEKDVGDGVRKKMGETVNRKKKEEREK